MSPYVGLMFSGYPISAMALDSLAEGFMPVDRSTQAREHALQLQLAAWRGIGSSGFQITLLGVAPVGTPQLADPEPEFPGVMDQSPRGTLP